MAEAVLERFPEAKIAIGPPIEDGFYYDFDLPSAVSEDDIKWVERRMRKILSQRHTFTMREVSPAEAKAIFHDQPYKLELIDDLVNGRVDDNGQAISDPADSLTIYTQSKFTDLCRGPHVESTKDINPKAVSISLRPPAGAYWRGDEKRQQLTRIYGTAWTTPAELAEHRARLAEAIRRDHRVLGEKLDLFIIDSMVGKGLPLWLPYGATLRDTLERWLRDIQIERGYLPVVTPHLGNIELYKTSGHYPYYADSQYTPIDVDGDEFLLRPMNCPHHCRIYTSQPRSYRDLPLRYAEFGTVYRYEQSGELRGLTRVRGFTVDDAHLFVRPDQLLDEFKGVVRLIQHVFSSLGMTDFRARLGTRDPDSDKYVGDNSLWEMATVAIIDACEELGMDYHLEPGEAAFYGPKLDFIVRDVLKREWQLGTVQVDYNLPQRFRPGICRPRQRAQAPGHDTPRAFRQPGALHRHPDRAFRRRLPALAGADAGRRHSHSREPQRLRARDREPAEVARHARQSRFAGSQYALQDQAAPAHEYPLAADRGRPRCRGAYRQRAAAQRRRFGRHAA